MKELLYSLVRYGKRLFLTRGYAAPVYEFLHTLPQYAENVFHTKADEYVINLSFDLEFAFNTYFWRGDVDDAIRLGQEARSNVLPVTSLLREMQIPFNVQIVGMLLNRDILEDTLLTAAQKNSIRESRDCFQLSEEYIHALTSPQTEIGIHGYSHRIFPDLSILEATHEVTQAVTLVRSAFKMKDDQTLFMSFPRNNLAHTEVLPSCDIYAWRKNTQRSTHDHEVPKGLWLSEGNFNKRQFRHILRDIRRREKSGFLHLWNHFNEMDCETLHSFITIAQEEGWTFSNISHIAKTL